MLLTHKTAALPAFLLIASAAASGIPTAYADLTITSKISATGLPGQPGTPAATPPAGGGDAARPQAALPKFPLIVTTYYKEGFARTEVQNGPVTLFNGSRERVYVLNPVDKTYYIKETETTRRNRFGSLKVDPKITVTKQDAAVAANAGTIAGTKVVKSAVGGTVDISFQPATDTPAPPAGDAGGTPPAPPAGATPPPAPGATPPAAPGGDREGRPRMRGFSSSIGVSGELWTSDSIALPTDSAFLLDPFVNELSFSGGGMMARAGQQLHKPLVDQLIALKALPLKSKLTVTTTNPFDQSKIAITTTFEVTKLSTSALPDDMFKVPEDYQQVDPPAPAWGGRGGRRNRGGDNGGGAAPPPAVQ